MNVWWTDLGRAPYRAVWDLQHRLVAELKAGTGRDRLLLVEHDPVITLGRRADPANVLAAPAELMARGYEVYAVERGGDVTYHGPGQLVAYPILDLRRHRRDVRWYSTALLAVAVGTAAAFGLTAHARAGAEAGVWVDLPEGGQAKLASLGVRIERWVTYHGLALNVTTDLAAFEAIVPCGLVGVQMTSLARLGAGAVDLAHAAAAFRAAFGRVFGVTLVEDPDLVAPTDWEWTPAGSEVRA